MGIFTRRHGGKFILRIEDTDRSRYVPGAVETIVESLRWAGLEYDEGPDTGGPHAPYFQSERLVHYREAAANLLTNPALDPEAKIPEFKVCAVRIEKSA